MGRFFLTMAAAVGWLPAKPGPAYSRSGHTPGNRVYLLGQRVSRGHIPPAKCLPSGVKVVCPRVTIRRRRFTRPPERAKMYRCLGKFRVAGVAPHCCDRDDPETMLAGVYARFARDMPESDSDILGEIEAFGLRWCERNLRPLDVLPDCEDWLGGTPYTEKRKEELRTARQAFGIFPSSETLRRVKSFMKTEPYMEWKNARGINSRVDIAKVFCGPIFAAIERQVYEVRQADGTPWFIKHVPVKDRPLMISQMRGPGRWFYSTDYTAFEAGMRKKVMLAFECVLYRYMLSKFPGHADAIVRMLTGLNHCVYKGFSVDIEATRMSGDMCTSLGNGYTNLMLWLFATYKMGVSTGGHVEGDDGLFWTDRPLTSEEIGDHSIFMRAGHFLKIKAEIDPCEANFCGCVFADQGVLKDPVKVFLTFSWTSSFIHAGPHVMESLLRSKGLSLAYECGSCPMLWALAQRALRETRGVRVTHRVDDGYHRYPDEESALAQLREPSTATRVLFQRLFGVTLEQQKAAEEYLLTGDISLLDPTRLYLNFAPHHYQEADESLIYG